MRTGKKAKGNTTKAAKRNPKTGGNATSSSATTSKKTSSTTQTVAAPTHEEIALRAEHIWRQGGCLSGRDDQNWHEAEAQLKAEAAAQ
jgi:hypothetical protein